jgi:hypothetical protein
VHDEILAPLDTVAKDLSARDGDDVGRPEAVRRILREWLIANAYLSESDLPVGVAVGLSEERGLSNHEDQAINAYYASGAPGVGAQFLQAIINHLRSELRQNPDITVEEVKEFVLDVFDDYGQDLEEHLKK